MTAGLCLLSVDNTDTYTVDLYDDSGNELQRQVIWTSPTLPYGSHNVTLFQAGQDQRFGCAGRARLTRKTAES